MPVWSWRKVNSIFDEGGEAVGIEGRYLSNPSLGPAGQAPHTVYESYHQQFRQLKRQQSSPMGSARQLPMAPFGHRRTASSSSFGHHQPTDLPSPGYYDFYYNCKRHTSPGCP